MAKVEEIEKSIITTFRKTIWRNFVKGINEYQMIQDGDKIAVCMSGGKDSALLAKCFQELKKHGRQNFEVVFICMNPGYNEANKQKILDNAKLLNIPIDMFETDIFYRVENITDSPCYICARMRRGYLYEYAKKIGCNKIVLGHHFDDVIETVLMSMLYGSQMRTMMPKIKSTNHPGMELIRPLYLVKEADIINWKEKNELEFINCACKITAKQDGAFGSKRAEMKNLINELRKTNPNVDVNIFRSAQNVNLDTIYSYVKDGIVHNFLDEY